MLLIVNKNHRLILSYEKLCKLITWEGEGVKVVSWNCFAKVWFFLKKGRFRGQKAGLENLTVIIFQSRHFCHENWRFFQRLQKQKETFFLYLRQHSKSGHCLQVVVVQRSHMIQKLKMGLQNSSRCWQVVAIFRIFRSKMPPT